MSYFDDASLVMIPSGYKTSKVYSVKPTDGTGDLAFTRSNDTATRVASSGLIEKVRTNLILQSQTFDNASWNKTTDGQVTITANAAAAPDGTTTAEKMIPSASAGFHCVAQTITLSDGEVTISLFAKAAENSFLQIFDSLTTDFANFNLTTGVVGSTDAYVASIQSAGNGWFRCTATKVVTSGSFVLRYGVVTTATAVRGESFTGNGTDGLLIWGAQAEQGVATAYIATTTAAVSVGPVANVPRLDYLNSSCPRLLLEPQRINLITFSEQFDNVAWGAAGTTITANQAVSPDGSTNADLAVNPSSTNYLYQGAGASPISGTYTASIFAKKGTQSSFAFGLVAGGFTGGMGVKFNFDTQTFSTPTNYANFTSISASYQSYGNGWYRLNLTGTTATSTNYFFVLGSLQESFPINAYVYGCQVEAGAYATSYIPTLGASVTRGADAASKTGISSLIGQTEGTLYWEVSNVFKSSGNGARLFLYADGSNFIVISPYGTILRVLIVSSGTAFDNFISISETSLKIAVAYKANDYKFYVNGVSVGTPSATSVPAMSAIGFLDEATGGAVTSQSETSQVLLFKTRLSNDSLAALTA